MPDKILIVDDDPTNVEKLYSFLQAKDFEIAVANNGERAYKVALSFKPDLVLMDVLMPGWDGYETCKVFKSDPQLQNIPIIFVTAKIEEAVKAFESGAADYVSKPFSHLELEARLVFQLKALRHLREVKQKNTNLEYALETKERQLIEANRKITLLEEKLHNIQSQEPEKNTLQPAPNTLSDDEFEKQINKP